MSLSTRRPAAVARCLVAGALVAGLGAISAAPATAVAAAPATASTTAVAADVQLDPIEDYIHSVYLDLLGRDVDAVGMDGWSNALRNGVPRIAVANGITSSDEFRGNLVSESFLAFLGRDPDPIGAEAWLAAMRSGITIQQLEAGILASPEYIGSAGDLEGFIKQVYLDTFGHPADDRSVSSWVEIMNGLVEPGYQHPPLPAVDFTYTMLMNDEALVPRIDGYYQYLLGRGIDPTGARDWVAAIQSGVRLELIVGGIIASDEYYAI